MVHTTFNSEYHFGKRSSRQVELSSNLYQVVIIVWDGYFFHDEIVADRYLSLRQAERWMCLWLQK